MIINLTLASLQEPYTAKLIAIRANLYQNQNRSYGAEKINFRCHKLQLLLCRG